MILAIAGLFRQQSFNGTRLYFVEIWSNGGRGKEPETKS